MTNNYQRIYSLDAVILHLSRGELPPLKLLPGLLNDCGIIRDFYASRTVKKNKEKAGPSAKEIAQIMWEDIHR